MRVLIIDNFDSFTYNLYQYVAELGGKPAVFYNNKITLADVKKGKYSHIIISPGPGRPDNLKDFGVCGQIIKYFSGKLPILGVCLGHQGIIVQYGGKIIKAPRPVHGKQSIIRIGNKHFLFRGLPKEIKAMRYHSLIDKKNSLPKELKVIAETVDDKLTMAVSHKTYPTYGIQFHPESIGTPYGKRILKNFLELR